MKAVVHIGAEKTGTTSIQDFCSRNRQQLMDVGVLYPKSLGASNHLKLTAYSLADGKLDDIRRDLGISKVADIPAFREQVRRELREEVHRAAGCGTILFSNEHLQSRLLLVREVERLKEFLLGFVDEIEIVVYLRRQDELAVSYYSTKLKAGGLAEAGVFPVFTGGEPLPRYYDFDTMLGLYESVFGIENITVRVFEPGCLIAGDLLTDFRASCGISEDAGFVAPPRRNESLSEVGIAFFQRFNELVPRFVEGKPNPKRADVINTVMKRFAGAGPWVARADARAFYDHFVASNRAIAKRYFPAEDGSLFNDNFDNYQTRHTPSATQTDLLDVAVHLWLERTSRVDELELENALLQFSIATKAKAALDVAGREAPVTVAHFALQPSSPIELSCRWIGALLYNREFGRAAEVAREMIEERRARNVFMVGLTIALCHLRDDGALGELAGRDSGNHKLLKSLATLRKELGKNPDGRAWVELLRLGDSFQRTFYNRCLRWLEQ